MKSESIIFINEYDLFKFAAEDFCQRAITSIHEKDKFSVVFSGGNTPKPFYDILAKDYKETIPWEKIKFFFSDERYVPVNDKNNNYNMVNEHLFSKVAVNRENIFRIRTEFSDPKIAAHEYENTLRKELQTDSVPQFDLVYLGLGEDAHTASLMPFSEVVKNILINNNILVDSFYYSKTNMNRITLTVNAINNSGCIIFLVTGKNKAHAVRNVLEGQTDPLQYPAQLIHCKKGRTLWFLDKASSTMLTKNLDSTHE